MGGTTDGTTLELVEVFDFAGCETLDEDASDDLVLGGQLVAFRDRRGDLRWDNGGIVFVLYVKARI